MTSQNRQLLAQYARRALDLLHRRLSQGPIAIPQIQESIVAQLEWLTDFGEGRNEERSRLFDLNFGGYLAKEETCLEDSGELAGAIHQAFYAASIYALGLRIDSFMPPNISLERSRES